MFKLFLSLPSKGLSFVPLNISTESCCLSLTLDALHFKSNLKSGGQTLTALILSGLFESKLWS